MGSWFSNLHVRKEESIKTETVCSCVRDILADKKYIPVESVQEADIVAAIVAPHNSQWISVCSQAFSHDDPDSCKVAAALLSATLHTDVMGVACFDSDYLYMNLINVDEDIDGWIGIGAGKEIGIVRRNNLAAWKKKVVDYPTFSAAAKQTYICAEEFLAVVEGCLGLPSEQGDLSVEYLQDISCRNDAQYLYFRHEEGAHQTDPELRVCNLSYACPCLDGRKNEVSFVNVGDEFCGISVYFMGPYVQQDEISFTDVKMERFQRPSIDLELKKIQLSNGQWAYCCHDPEILMPSGVPQRMRQEKRYQLLMERMRTVSFVPHGNPRKMLDITVVIVPDGNPDNRAQWNVWQPYGSKDEFIKHHNKIWKRMRAFVDDPNELLPLLKREDFD